MPEPPQADAAGRSRKGERQVHGTNRELITVQCCVCKKFVALRVDKLAAVQHGKALIQDACPYLSADERELFLTGTCRDCWDLLCPADRLAYS